MVSYIALIFYILAFFHILLFLVWGNRKLKALFNIFMGLGLIFNISDIALRWINTGSAPTSTLYDLLILVSISFGITYFILYAKFRRPLIGMFISPFMSVLGIIAVFFPPSIAPSYPVVDSIWRYVHLPFIILGTTFLLAAFLSSIMYMIQERQLKGKNFGFIFHRFPPLDTIGRINESSLTIGFFFFSIGVALGFVWMLQNGLEGIMSSAKIIFSVLTWFLFAFLIYFKRKKSLSPKMTAQWTVLGFVLIMLTYFGVALFLLR